MGGYMRRNDSSTNVDVAETERIVESHRKLFESFG